jgi:hypothetical protein
VRLRKSVGAKFSENSRGVPPQMSGKMPDLFSPLLSKGRIGGVKVQSSYEQVVGKCDILMQ